ncbi:MAG: hypothetical protein QE269_11740 [Fimbriimonas sp.]|nr:hypothetical protein [Fimbriimonas sp.]
MSKGLLLLLTISIMVLLLVLREEQVGIVRHLCALVAGALLGVTIILAKNSPGKSRAE